LPKIRISKYNSPKIAGTVVKGSFEICFFKFLVFKLLHSE
jgi:hypothetical protein